MQSHAIVVLSLFKVRDYANAVMLSKIQCRYLEEIGHPALAAVKYDPMLLAEDRGEQSLAGVATSTQKLTNKSDVGELDRAYKLQHALRAVTHDALDSLGIDQSKRTHTVITVNRLEEVHAAKRFLHKVRSDLRNDELLGFALFGDYGSDDGETGEGDGIVEEVDSDREVGPAPLNYRKKVRVTMQWIERDAQLEGIEPRVWLDTEYTDAMKTPETIVRDLKSRFYRNKAHPGID
jgi:hypothetical protein